MKNMPADVHMNSLIQICNILNPWPLCAGMPNTELQQTNPVATVRRDAGTDCGVFLMVYGDKAASGQVVLGSSPDWFTPGKEDVFTLELPDMGALDKLVVGHDGRGNAPHWHLDAVTVCNVTDDKPGVVFRCGEP